MPSFLEQPKGKINGYLIKVKPNQITRNTPNHPCLMVMGVVTHSVIVVMKVVCIICNTLIVIKNIPTCHNFSHCCIVPINFDKNRDNHQR